MFQHEKWWEEWELSSPDMDLWLLTKKNIKRMRSLMLINKSKIQLQIWYSHIQMTEKGYLEMLNLGNKNEHSIKVNLTGWYKTTHSCWVNQFCEIHMHIATNTFIPEKLQLILLFQSVCCRVYTHSLSLSRVYLYGLNLYSYNYC